MSALLHWLSHHDFLSISLTRWAIAALITVVGSALLLAICRVAAGRLRKQNAKTSNLMLSVIVASLDNTRSWLVLLFFAAIGAHALGLKDRPMQWIGYVGAVVAALQVGLWINSGIKAWASGKLNAEDARTRNPVVMAMLSWMLRIMVWATLLLAVLSFMGVNITAFVASLGVGGVAVALALQNVLGDLFASMAIGLDKPVEIGHFVVFGDIAGTVEYVGVKTTRIRALSGEEVVISNSRLLGNTIHNYGRMQTRRIVFSFGVTYDTPPERLRELPDVVKDIVESNDKVRFDRAHFKAFGDSSLDYEVVYTMLEADYTLYMDVQQRINFAMVERFAEMDVEFAFPSRTLYVAGRVNASLQDDGDSGDGEPHREAGSEQAAT